MAFKVGDSVLVLDEDLSGVIKQIHEDVISIETKDGFLLNFKRNEIILNRSSKGFKQELFSNSNANEVISEKEKPVRKNKPVQRTKDRYEPTMEVDLHIHQLTESTRGMDNYDMLNLQIETAKHKIEYAIRNRIPKIVFIHGVGAGVLKTELDFLFNNYHVDVYAASFKKYGLGATEVYIYQNPKK